MVNADNYITHSVGAMLIYFSIWGEELLVLPGIIEPTTITFCG